MLENTYNQEILNLSTSESLDDDLVIHFDGTYDFIYDQNSTYIDGGVYTERTISLWFQVDDKDISDRKQIIYEEDGTTRGLKIYVEDGRLFFDVWNQIGNEWSGSYSSTNEIASNNWHHVSLVLDEQEELANSQAKPFTAYLDGVDIDEGEGEQPDLVDIGIGGLNPNNNQETGGSGENGYSIDDVRVYNRALTAEEIALLFNPNDDPKAVNDITVTVENTEVIILPSILLDNDTDADDDILRLSAVGNVTNGSISQNSEGNLVFMPEFNFSGDASFEYTISDGQGGTDTATVTVNVLPATKPVPIGTNLHRLVDWSPELPFLDGFKSARTWITQDIDVTIDEEGEYVNTWNTKESDLLDLDENGWVKSLPAPEDDPEYSSVGTLMFREVNNYPEGKYVVLYEGEGTIEYKFDARKDEDASTPGRDVIDVTSSNAGIWLRISSTDPNNTGDYLRNIKVIQEKYEYADSQIFNPDFLDVMQYFDTLRFMDWMGTNNSQQSEWSERPRPDSSIFSTNMASVEEMVELANRTDTDPWFTIPHMATDEYVTNFAQYVKDNLNPDLKVYVEYSNEVWNRDFEQGSWVEKQGNEEWSESLAGNYTKRIDWYSKRTTEITQIWDEVFDTDKDQVIGVLGAQAANSWTANRALQFKWTEDPMSHEEYGIDAIAIAPYTGSYLGNPENEEEVESWTTDPDDGLDKLFEELTEGGVLSTGPEGGAFQQAYDWTEAYFNLANQEDLSLITYEVGQHLRGNNGTEENQAITDLFVAANRDARMGELYQEYFSTLSELGVDLSMNYSDVSAYNKWGSWGVLEHINQESSPKFNILKSLTAKNVHHLPPQLGRLKDNLSSLGLIVEGDTLTLKANYTDVNIKDFHNLEFAWGDDSPIDLEEKTPLLGEIGKASGSHIYNSEGIYTAKLTVTDQENLVDENSLSVTVAKKIDLDWRPGSTSQTINLTGNGQIRVNILGTANFDVAEIDPTSVRADDEKDVLLNGGGIGAKANNFILEDTNDDGWQDLALFFGKSDLRSVVETNSELLINDNQIYLLGNSSQLESGYFFGTEQASDI